MDPDILKRALDRERKARKEAERIIEQKSLEIYRANRELKQLNQSLEQRIRERTREIEASRKDLMLAKEEAEAATKAKSLFLSTMSHEIRTPLNGIIGITELMMKINGDKRLEEMLANMKYSADNLLVIINDILDFSKIEAGKITFEKIDFSLDTLLEGLRQTFRFRREEKNLSFTVEKSPDVPAWIVGDRVKLNQILINLVGNAFKFTSHGHIRVQVTQSDQDTEGLWLQFSVKDSGVGIPRSRHDRIFQSFTQSEKDTVRKYGGTGLGLAITRRLIELQGGCIFLESERNKGAHFYFQLPFGRGRAPVTTHDNKAIMPDAQLRGRRILLAEDNKINQFVATKFLKNWGLDVDIANTGQEAVDMVADNVYDLVLMDIQMPVMGGVEAAGIIRQWEQKKEYRGHLPIIALTASAFDEIQQEAIQAGMDDFTTKPIQQKALYARILKWILSK
ncbi:hypothetical protein SAMN02746065_1274 [Desulfocicer vacuolatum DSM 3385]|uniref:histidine kinase n=1 Tax=Desulfocicer vacuolatum DSM 3385 TaxID=1121400 RepID=A0A1W2E904_9BACT|nr:ATP-binding protein [Desulfocicer vacuolatum]SMD06221.1 hypothetical protein SAMN02746065_1274 [Desulfocicer vacuolatum DSM 3385]